MNKSVLALALAALLPQGAAADIGEANEFSRDASVLSSESLQAVELLDDGSFIVVGYQSDGSGDPVAVALKYNPDATLDISFGADGIAVIDAGAGDDYGWTLDIDPAGRIVVAGQTENGGANDAFVARLTTDGSLDTSFSGDGILLIDRGSAESIWKIDRSSTGDLYAAGSTGSPFPLSNDASGLVARIDSTGNLVGAFGTSGVQEFKPGTAAATDYAIYTSIAINPDDGKLLVGGYMDSSDTSSADVLVHAYQSTDGSFNTAFAGDGRLEATGSGYEELWDIELQSDGTVVVAGYSRNVNDRVFIGAANADGTVDTSFGSSGSTTVNVDDNGDTTFDIVVDASDRILMSGYASDADGDRNTFIARFEAGGDLDESFGTDGLIRKSRSIGDDRYIGIAYDSKDRLVSVGDADDDEDAEFDRQIGVVYAGSNDGGSGDGDSGGGGGSLGWMLLVMGMLLTSRFRKNAHR